MWPERALLAHAIPIEHSADADPLITFSLLAVGVFASIAAGLLLARALPPDARSHHVARAFALGALVFLLFDLLKETASLGQGVTARPIYQATLLGAYAVGIIALAGLGSGVASQRLAWTWALLGIGAHGMGEAWIVGTEAYTADLTSLTQSSSFLIHKLIEGFTIPLVASMRPTRPASLAIAGGVTTLALLGAVGGFLYGAGTLPLAFFAIGAGATTYALLLLARRTPPIVQSAAWIAVGVVVIYLAGLLHQY